MVNCFDCRLCLFCYLGYLVDLVIAGFIVCAFVTLLALCLQVDFGCFV